MAVTAKQAYDIALSLIDEVQESGSIQADQPEYYEAKALKFLTMLQTELLPVTTTPTVIVDIDQELALTDKVALSVLPYGLAAHLLIQEDPNTASFFNNRYDELKRKIPSKIQPIQDVYGVVQSWQS